MAERLLADSIRKQGVERDQLVIHADRGSSMCSKPVAFLLADLGVTKSHSRPHCSNDNPYSEAQFKTLKYRPEFPDRFGSAQDARAFSKRFFGWYNDHHRHSSIGYHTPADLHYGRAGGVRQARAVVLAGAHRGGPVVNPSTSDFDHSPTPVGNGFGNGAGVRRCLVCLLPARGRSAYCSDAHRVQAHRLRHRQTLDFQPDAPQAELHRRRQLAAHTVYECEECGERFLGQQQCPQCRRFFRTAGLGGLCPGCDQPLLVTELLGELPEARP